MADNDDDFATLFEQSMTTGSGAAPRPRQKRLKAGQVVKGTVVAIGDDTIFVDVGTKAEARLDRNSMLDDKGQLKVGVGDTVKATVANPGGRTPPQLVVAYGGGSLDAEALELAAQSGTPVEGEVTKAVKAGLEVSVGGVRAFCPASQAELGYVADLEVFVGQRHFFKVLEVRDGGRSVVVSRKAVLLAEREEKAAELATRLAEGEQFDGIVQTIQPYGVFVDIGGIQGLVHISQMAHSRVTAPSDLVQVGESVRVQVLTVEQGASGKPADTRVSLSMKALVQPTAQETAADTGEVISATVVKVESFGILVETPAGEGLVPNGELALPPGSDPRRAFSAGDTIEVVLQRRDNNGRLRFSAKAVEEAEARRNFRQFRTEQKKNSGRLGSLGDLGNLLAGVDLPDAPKGSAAKPAAADSGQKPSRTESGPGPAPGPRKGRRRRV